MPNIIGYNVVGDAGGLASCPEGFADTFDLTALVLDQKWCLVLALLALKLFQELRRHLHASPGLGLSAVDADIAVFPIHVSPLQGQ